MAIASTAVWEVRPTVGSDTNGGGFDPAISGAGTDYSQQNAAQYSATDLASVSSLVVSSVSHSFVSADVGNIMNIASGTGFTPGFYEIVSVSAGQATLDRSPGTVGAGGAYAVGGALATVAGVFASVVNGNSFYLKDTGSLTVTSALSIGSMTLLTFIGYTTTRGDGGRVVWTTATNSTNLLTFAGSQTIAFYNIYFSNSASVRADCCPSPGSGTLYTTFINCVFDGFVTAIDGNYNENYQYVFLLLISCEVKNCSAYGVENSGPTLVIASYIHDCATAGFYAIRPQSNPSYTFIRTAFASNGVGLTLDNIQDMPLTIENCVFYDNTGDGLQSTSSPSLPGALVLFNSIFYGNGGYGIGFSAIGTPPTAFIEANAFGDNTSGARSNFPYGSAGDISLTADPFVNGSAGDFSLNSTTGGGTSCKGAGFPSALP